MIRLLLVILSVVSVSARPLELSRQVTEESRTILVKEWGEGSPALLNSDRIELELPAVFELSAEAPSFLLLRAEANQPTRLIVHLEAPELPTRLLEKAPDNDWSNPGKRYDFRCVVEMQPNRLHSSAIDLGSDFFESVSKQRSPFDLSGRRINKIAIELVRPVSAGQNVRLHGIHVLTLTPKAMQLDLRRRESLLEGRLAESAKDSKLYEIWKPRIQAVSDQVREFDSSAKGAGIHWRRIVDHLQRLEMASRKWNIEPAVQSGYAVGIESSLRRVSGSHPLLTFRGEVSKEINLEAAANESESFQLVILPVTLDLKDVTIEVSSLSSVEGSGIIDGSQVAFYRQIEQWVKPSPGTASSWAGWMPDALVPLSGSFDVGLEEIEALWVTIQVPGGTPAGNYRGRITVKPGNAAARQIVLKLQVHSFALPRVGRFRTQGHLSHEGIRAWYGSNFSEDVLERFYRLLVEYRFSPTSQYSARLSPEPDQIPWIMRAGANVILIGGFSGRDLDPEIIDPAYRWLETHDYLDRAIIYIGDETNDFERVRTKSLTIRERWPGLRIMVGGSKPREDLIGYVDVWDPITAGGDVYNFEAESTRAAQKRGEEVFWYTCIGPRWPYANVYNDHPLTAIRALWWQAWKYQVTGFEYWWFNRWEPNSQLSKGDKPWPLFRTREWNSRSFDWANGDGLLVYPGPGGQALPSLRLSVIRDAIEDWETLFILARTLELARETGVAAELLREAEKWLQVPETITADLRHWNQDPEVYQLARSEVLKLIGNFRQRLGSKRVDRYIQEWVDEHQQFLQESFKKRVSEVKGSN